MLYILISVIFYVTAIMLTVASSRLLNSNMVTAIINSVAAIIPVLLIIPLLNKKVAEQGKWGIILAAIAGISISLFTLALNKSFSVNKVALVTPIVYGGAIALTAILSYFIFKEKLSPTHLTGVLVVVAGILIIIYSATTGK